MGVTVLMTSVGCHPVTEVVVNFVLSVCLERVDNHLSSSAISSVFP